MKRVWGLMLFCFGLGMAVLFFVPETIFTFFFVIGCLILGFGVYTEVLANVAMLPGESFVRAIVMT